MVHCRSHGAQRTSYLPEGENFIQFNEKKKMQKLPFCIYSDFETINKKVDNSEYLDDDEEQTSSSSSGMRKKTNHQVSGFTFYTVSDYFPPNCVSYRGEDADKVFLENIQAEKERILKVIKDIKPMKLTPEEKKQFNKARRCHICRFNFLETDEKVRDHCHFTGKEPLLLLLLKILNFKNYR